MAKVTLADQADTIQKLSTTIEDLKRSAALGDLVVDGGKILYDGGAGVVDGTSYLAKNPKESGWGLGWLLDWWGSSAPTPPPPADPTPTEPAAASAGPLLALLGPWSRPLLLLLRGALVLWFGNALGFLAFWLALGAFAWERTLVAAATTNVHSLRDGTPQSNPSTPVSSQP